MVKISPQLVGGRQSASWLGRTFYTARSIYPEKRRRKLTRFCFGLFSCFWRNNFRFSPWYDSPQDLFLNYSIAGIPIAAVMNFSNPHYAVAISNTDSFHGLYKNREEIWRMSCLLLQQMFTV